jgi:hypothetical protein
MAIRFNRQYQVTTHHELDQYESRLGSRIPLDYRKFVTSNGVGYLERALPVRGTEKGLFVGAFLGSDPSLGGPTRLDHNVEKSGERWPSWFFPFAEDDLGNYFGLSLRDSDHGSVWDWDHEMEADEGEPPTEENLTYVARSFSDFLSLLEDKGDDGSGMKASQDTKTSR